MMNLTLVIPTYNRPDSLARLLCVLRQFEYSGQVLIADSSSAETKKLNQQRASEWKAVSYVDFPSETPPFKKFARAIGQTKTSLVMLLADDDLAFPDGLSECVAFLDANPSYSAAHGIYLNYVIDAQGISVPRVEYDGPSLTAKTPFGRLNDLMENYQALTYCVQRKECAVKAFETASGLKDVLWQELTGSSLTALHGSVKRLPIISHARQGGSTLGYRHWHPVEWLARDASGLFAGFSEYVRTIQSTVEHMDAATNLSSEEILEAANLAGLSYLAPYLEHMRAIALMKHPLDASPDQKAVAAIDQWNDLRVKFPASLLLRHKTLARFARRLKHNTSKRLTGGYRTNITSDDGFTRRIEFGRDVLRTTKDLGGKDELDRLAHHFARYLCT